MRIFDRILFLISTMFVLIFSYDTGHHSDLTRNALQVNGYSADAQTVGAISNWFVDYFSYTPVPDGIDDLKSLHFDNLHHMLNVSNYMTQLVRNTMNATQYAVQQNDPITYLALLGASLHCVQDFYTHSSWAEHHQTSCGCYRQETWFSELASQNGSVPQLFDRFQEVRTYSWGDGCNEYERNCLPGQIIHGGYCEGVNKDSYVRPWFERSYGHSFAASVEWIYNFEQWIGSPDLINAAKTYVSGSDSDDLGKDYESSIEVSYATKNPVDGEENGHYKGAGSGDIKRLVTSTIDFSARHSVYKKKFTDEKVWKYLTSPNLYDVANYDTNTLDNSISAALQFVTPFTSLPSSLTSFNKIKIRTAYASVERIGTPSPYAVIEVDGMQFIESVMHDKQSFNPHWTTIKYISTSVTSIPIQYALWDDKFPTSDNLKDITDDGDGKLDVVYDIASHSLTGDATGTFDSSSNTLTANNGGNTVKIFITTEQAGNCVLIGNPEPYCPNEAYTDLRVYADCGVSDVVSSGSMLIISSLLLLAAFFCC